MADVVHDADNERSYAFIVGCIAFFTLWLAYKKNRHTQAELGAIPVIGYSKPILSYITATKFVFKANDILREGYERYPEGVFRVATWSGWKIFVCGKRLIEEMRMQSKELLSSEDAARDVRTAFSTFSLLKPMQSVMTPYTMDIGVSGYSEYHKDCLIRLTRSLPSAYDFADFNLEVEQTLEMLPSRPEDLLAWTPYSAMNMSVILVHRIWSRMLVGLPFWRRREYASRFERLAHLLLRIMPLFRLLPSYLTKQTYLSVVSAYLFRSLKTVGQQRVEDSLEYDSPYEPNNYLTWILNNNMNDNQPPSGQSKFLMYVPTFAMVPLSLTCREIIYNLAKYPDCFKVLRREVDQSLRQPNFSPVALDSMVKLDSFIKESVRLGSYHSVAMVRKTMKPFSFSNGITIPSGYILSVPSIPIHLDPQRYPNPHNFDAFRFVPKSGDGQVQHQLISTSSDFLAWGHGPDACPGRFIASTLLKLIVARIVYDYDLRLDDVDYQGKDVWIEMTRSVNFKAGVLIRRRAF